jgi:hypothetical protein
MVSRQFPAYHPRKGQPTSFVEKIWKSLYVNNSCPDQVSEWINNYVAIMKCDLASFNDIHKKLHTIRSGSRFKAGATASLKVWSGRPYWTSPIEFAQVKIVKTLPVDIYFTNGEMRIMIDGNIHNNCELVAKNDGLELADFYGWFQKPMSGQIICFSDVNY